jgi:hypothetical protein
MKTTALIRPQFAPRRAARRSDAGHNAAPSASDHPTLGEVLAEIIPLIGVIPGYGPPVILLVGPWLLLVLMLSGPFAFLVILVVFMVVAATVLVVLTAAILAPPYLLVRALRKHRTRHALRNGHVAHIAPVESTRAAR